MSDTYELAKANQDQSISAETPYGEKQFNFINDINSGVYQNSQQSLVQFDLSSIYNSGKFIDISQMYLTIPIVYTACFSSATPANVAPTANMGSEFLVTPKSGSWNLIQSLEVVVNGQTVIQQQPNINFHTNFKMLSQMSKDDLKTLGKTLGMQPDDVQSYLYNGSSSALSATSGALYGNGLCNNAIFPVFNSAVSFNGNNTTVGNQGVTDMYQQSACTNYGTQGTVYNTALQERSKRIANNQTTPANGFNQLFNTNNLNSEFLPYYQVTNGTFMNWYDVAVIRVCDVCDFFQQAPLTKNFDGLLRIYLNSGAMLLGLSKATGGMSLTASNSTFVNTCPFMVNQLPLASIPANVTNLAVSCNIARTTVSQALNGTILSQSSAIHPMNACRCYYPMISLKPSVALKYVSENRAKKIVFTNVLSNVMNTISAGSTYNQLVQSGVRNIRGILIIPFISQSTHGVLNTGGNAFTTPIIPFALYASPFDSAPNTTPMSLTQLNVSIGGVNELMNFYNYTYENFVQQVNLYDKINSTDMGLSCGLISQYMWEHGMRFYYVDLSRATMADQNFPRNVNVTFQNNSQQTIDCWCFTEYFDEKVLDCETGSIA